MMRIITAVLAVSQYVLSAAGKSTLLPDLDFKTVEIKAPSHDPRLSPPQPLSLSTETVVHYRDMYHDGEQLCIATVDDGSVLTAAVMNENGDVHVALPEGHETLSSVQCTSYANATEGLAGEPYDAPLSYAPPSGCDPKHFQPGYYDRSQRTWHDLCTGQVTKADGSSPFEKRRILSTGVCPGLRRGKDIWISFVGDSVQRLFFESLHGHRRHRLAYSSYAKWRVGRSGRRDGDFILYRVSNAKHSLWFSFTFNFLTEPSGSNSWDLPHRWGDFVRDREESHRPHDPQWPDTRVPDMVFYNPGYHASKLSATAYGAGIEQVLHTWQEVLQGYNAPMPTMHLVLNMMPAPWLIPEKYAADRRHRTLLNEYRKNLALIGAAAKFDFVRSVVDLFSIELPFNGAPGRPGAHMDAVHVSDQRVLRMAGDRILDTLCRSL